MLLCVIEGVDLLATVLRGVSALGWDPGRMVSCTLQYLRYMHPLVKRFEGVRVDILRLGHGNLQCPRRTSFRPPAPELL